MLALLLALALAAAPADAAPPLPDTLPEKAGPDAPAMLRGERKGGGANDIDGNFGRFTPISPRYRAAGGNMTALEVAAAQGDVEAMAWLVERGLPVNGLAAEAGRTAMTPLTFAATAGRSEAARWLIDHGAAVDAIETHPTLQTPRPLRVGPLGAAVPGTDDSPEKAANRRDIMRMLLDAGADPDVGGGLVGAARVGDAEAAKILLDAGANPDGIWFTEEEVALLRERNLLRNMTRVRPIALAAANGRDEVVRLLLEAGASLDVEEAEGAFALLGPNLAAAAGQSPPLLRAMLARGVQFKIDRQTRATVRGGELVHRNEGPFGRAVNDRAGDFPGGPGGEALLRAAVTANAETLRLLVGEAGVDDPAALGKALAKLVAHADPERIEDGGRGRFGPVPDDAARAEAVKVLAGAGAVGGLPMDRGWLALAAAAAGADRTLAALAEAGVTAENMALADVPPETRHELQLLYMLEPPTVRRMADAGLPLDLNLAAAIGDLDAVRRRLADGADPDGFGYGALVLAAFAGHAEVADALLAAGADPNVNQGAGPWTPGGPLEAAATRGHAEVVRALLAAGADPTVKDADGTPLPARLRRDADTDPKVLRLIEAAPQPRE